jgi:hypothetical protein
VLNAQAPVASAAIQPNGLSMLTGNLNAQAPVASAAIQPNGLSMLTGNTRQQPIRTIAITGSITGE